MNENKYLNRIELHCHTGFSKMEATSSVKEIVDFATTNGINSVAFTDYANVIAYPEIQSYCEKKDDFKPIYGIEANVVDDIVFSPLLELSEHPKTNHMTILAKNMDGIKDIYKLVSDSNLKFSNLRPRMRLSDILAKRGNLIIGSSDSSGLLFDAVMEKKTSEDIETIASIFDFLEVQPSIENLFLIDKKNVEGVSCLEDLININRQIIELGEKLNIPVVATSDTHFLRPENEIGYRILKAEEDLSNAASNLYFRTTDEMLEEFSFLPEAKAREIVVENTNRISEQIDYVKPNLLNKPIYHKNGDFERLKELCFEGIKRIYPCSDYINGQQVDMNNIPQDAKNRLLFELLTIEDTKTAYYYLWFYDLLKSNNLNPIQYSLRGNAASLYVCYLLGISHTNPLDSDTKLYPDFFMGLDGTKQPDINMIMADSVQSDILKAVKNLPNVKNAYKATAICRFTKTDIEEYIRKYEEKYVKLTGVQKAVTQNNLLNVVKCTRIYQERIVVVPDGVNETDYAPFDIDNESGDAAFQYDYHSIDYIFDTIDIHKHDNCTINARMYEITGYYPTDEDIKGEEILSLVRETDCASIPGLSEPFTRMLIGKLQPKSFVDLIKVKGISYGTNTWLDNGEVLVRDGKANIDTLISTREDVYEMMKNYAIKPGVAFHIAEDIRKGKMASDIMQLKYKEEIQEKGIPDWYIWSCKQIRYLPSRAQVAEYMLMELRTLYYKHCYPQIFSEIVSKNIF